MWTDGLCNCVFRVFVRSFHPIESGSGLEKHLFQAQGLRVLVAELPF